MKRLTEEKQVGVFASLKDKSEAVPGAFGTYECFYAHEVAVTQLKRYEDTGLMPEEITVEKPECVFYCNRRCNLDDDWCAEGPGCPWERDSGTIIRLLTPPPSGSQTPAPAAPLPGPAWAAHFHARFERTE